MLRVLDLFSGIGGFSLGLERTGGFKTVAFCEIDPFCRKVLAKHWPKVPCYDDVRTLTGERLSADGVSVDVVCGGFPCQDVSLAGRRVGLDGDRSGLWAEYGRLVGELRPQFVIVENTPGLLSLGMDRVLGDLASLGFDAEWHSIPACYVGADHIRDRVWLVAYPNVRHSRHEFRPVQSPGEVVEDAPDAVRSGLSRRCHTGADFAHAEELTARPRLAFDAAPAFSREYREHKPVLGRRVHGVSSRVDRLRALGNAVVPQIPELIGNAILASLKQAEAA
jgi:DNA (cytosine-5)-methyltransferase 1